MRALGAVVTLAVAACSSAEDAGPPPVTPDEQRSLAEARSMIPASELPPPAATPATPAATESPTR